MTTEYQLRNLDALEAEAIHTIREVAAETVPEVMQEMLLTRTSERSGRLVDRDEAASLEKKREGYF